jgi:hypothetical protein
MKIILSVLLMTASMNAFATVDAMTSAWIVVQNIDSEVYEDFGVQKVPVMGCYGLAQGPQLVQFTAEHNIKATMGCGDSSTETININALSCATLVESVESDDYISFKKIVLDISKCAYKNNKKFITMVRTAASRNFPQTVKGQVISGKEVNLVLIK